MIPILQISQIISQENHCKFNQKSIVHLYRENIDQWDTINMERMIPLTEIELLVNIPYIRDVNNPLTEDELKQYDNEFKEIYNEIEDYIIHTTQALFKSFRFLIKEGLVFEAFIYTPFIKYMPTTRQFNITFFYSFELGNGDLYFNIIEFFDRELREIDYTSVLNEVKKMIFDVRHSYYCTSDETYHYLEVNFPELNHNNEAAITISGNYILQNFLKINYDIELDIEKCIPSVSFFTGDESYKNNEIKIIFLTNMSMIVFGPVYDLIENEELVATRVIKSFLFRILNIEYFREQDSESDRYLQYFNEANLAYLYSFIKNNDIIGLTKFHENMIKKDYRSKRSKNMKKFTLELSENAGSLIRGIFKPEGL